MNSLSLEQSFQIFKQKTYVFETNGDLSGIRQNQLFQEQRKLLNLKDL